MRCPELIWMTPITVHMKDGALQVFASVNDALDFLEGDWAIYHGRKYNRAVQTCRRALNRVTPVTIAREAFVDACREAGMATGGDAPPAAKTGTGGQRSLG